MARYQPLSQSPESLNTAGNLRAETLAHNKRLRGCWLACGGVFAFAIILWLSQRLGTTQEWVPPQLARTNRLGTVYKRFWWNTAYSPANRSDADLLWNEINPAHGIVSVDREWAATQGWPLSLHPPGDKTKAVYLLEAYHLLHCIRIMRLTFWEAIDGKPFTYHIGPHLDHCFDALRQNIQCNADNTPLYSFGDHTAGNGQLHRCNDWEQLRTWAAANTACYRDSIEEIPLADHFGFCRDNGDDGVKDIEFGAIIE
ncbi:hypothetical protein F4825DRAFT_281324 [Nemania diffusa]|nr:hypothetical protein F4825DRAFT_281324 [Nemania diffusa]